MQSTIRLISALVEARPDALEGAPLTLRGPPLADRQWRRGPVCMFAGGGPFDLGFRGRRCLAGGTPAARQRHDEHVLDETGALVSPAGVVSQLKRRLDKQFEGILLSTKVVSLKEQKNGVKVTLEDRKGEASSKLFDQVLVSVGRRPNIENLGLDKAGIVGLGLELGAPFDLTWSCYVSDEVACGRCSSCLLRLKGFAAAGISDPIPYQ